MQTPFGVSRSARSPAMRVLAVCLDRLPQTHPPFMTINERFWGSESNLLYSQFSKRCYDTCLILASLLKQTSPKLARYSLSDVRILCLSPFKGTLKNLT